MFLPLGDAPNYADHRPWVNWGLLAANVAVYAWAALTHDTGPAYQAWIQEWGFVPVAPRLETFFSSMFMHADILHVTGNLVFLWVLGDNVEGRLGHLGYLLAYLACGLVAVLLFWALAPGSTVPLVGASGAIFGVAGFYFLAFPQNRVRVLFWIVLIWTVWIPARAFLGLLFLWDLISLFQVQGEAGGGGVAYAAHVGGFGCGLVLSWAATLLAPAATREGAPRRGPSHASAALLATADEALARGDLVRTREALESILGRHLYAPEAPEAAFRLGFLLSRAEGRPEAAREALRFAARLHPDPGRRQQAQMELQRLRVR